MSDASVSREALISSVAAAGTALGPAIGRHFESTFRCLVGQKGVVSEPRFFRMLSGAERDHLAATRRGPRPFERTPLGSDLRIGYRRRRLDAVVKSSSCN
jgi:hypothetical protein